MRKWRSVGLAWSFRSIEPLGFDHVEVDRLLAGMVSAGAFENNSSSLGFSALEEQLSLLQVVQQLGLVTCKGAQDIRWFLTDAGAKDLVSCAKLSKPLRLFHVPADLPLEDATVYELAISLQQAGWQWQPWVPVSKRTRRLALAGHMFDDHVPGGPKIWYSTERPGRSYMLVLLQAQSLFDMGLPAIAHCQEEARYKALLKGDIEAKLARGVLMAADVEALADAPAPVRARASRNQQDADVAAIADAAMPAAAAAESDEGEAAQDFDMDEILSLLADNASDDGAEDDLGDMAQADSLGGVGGNPGVAAFADDAAEVAEEEASLAALFEAIEAAAPGAAAAAPGLGAEAGADAGDVPGAPEPEPAAPAPGAKRRPARPAREASMASSA